MGRQSHLVPDLSNVKNVAKLTLTAWLLMENLAFPASAISSKQGKVKKKINASLFIQNSGLEFFKLPFV